MSTPKAEPSSASALRAAFDRSFAEPRAGESESQVDYLAIRVGSDPYAVALAEVASLHADHPIVAAPSAIPELLGIAGFRGVIVPIYDLRLLLGSGDRGKPRWLMLARSPERSAPGLIGFAFDELQAHLRLSSADVFGAAPSVETAAQVPKTVRALGGSRPILHVSSLLHALASRIAPSGPAKER